jgi:hypothetical protein
VELDRLTHSFSSNTTSSENATDARHDGHVKSKLRFGIMCHGTLVPVWQAHCIQHLIASGTAEPALIIVEPRQPRVGLGRQIRALLPLKRLLYRLYDSLWIERRLRALSPVDVARELGHLPSMTCVPTRHDRYSASFADSDVLRIRNHHLDFILQFAFDGIDGEILTAATFGVWSYRQTNGYHSHGLGVFWELYHDEPYHRTKLLRLGTDGSDIVLHSGSFQTMPTYARTIDAALLGGADWCARVCREIRLGQLHGTSSTPALPHRVPTNRQFLLFIARRSLSLVRGAFRRAFLLEYWNVGVVDAPIAQIIAAGRPDPVRWLTAPGCLRYHADPFALCDRPDAILIEEYSHATGMGWISWLSTLTQPVHPRPIEIFGRTVHRSYPFIFLAEGSIFCVPESAVERRVDIYRSIRFPDLWRLAGTLINDFPALDSTIFYHAGLWWLFCTSADEGGEHKLYAWHAQSVLGPWRPHALNPLKCDVSSSRPAGRPFAINGELHRPAQDCSRTYGGAITINRIVTLTPTEFAETAIGRIGPATDGSYADGVHTICPLGNTTIVDGKRFAIDLRAGYLKTKQTLARRRTAKLRRGQTMTADLGSCPPAS